jgi:hypothetical protein
MALGTPAGATDIALDPRATYLHVCSDAALDATPVALAGIGISPGEFIVIEALGDWDNGPGADVYISTIAVFSASAVLLAGSQLHRVPDAIDVGMPVTTANTFFCNEVTDIAEDFRVALSIPNTSVIVQVPAGATHLFLSAGDHLFEDNTDADGDYAVRITEMTVAVEPTTWGAVKALYRLE